MSFYLGIGEGIGKTHALMLPSEVAYLLLVLEVL
jgi:hypothetical protein